MNIEEKIFKRYQPDFSKLKKYGFKENNNVYTIEKLFSDNSFKAEIKVNSDGMVFGTVFDIENGEEFLPLRIDGSKGAFIGQIRTSYEQLLCDIRDNCFIKNYFIYPQSNRITQAILKKYGNEPEFLWEKFSGSGVFRNPQTNKWYIIIMDIDRQKIEPDKKGTVEVADVKLPPEKIERLLKQKNFYPAYHMNKKSWISFILDDSLADEKVMELIDESYCLSFSNKKH